MWPACFMAVLYEATTLVHTHINTTKEEKYNDRNKKENNFYFFTYLWAKETT